jgi:uncharacterized membrane protein YraQ (UPF0718 family)/regulator of protease activity HflC (stomatin/prohibitin superfamily)
MEFLLNWIQAIWVVLCESGPFLLLGFFLAGLLKVLIPEETVFKYLGRNDMRSVGIAACCGIPIPLCSCSVVPTAISLRQSGASKGATTSFLISTPETGVDSIGITWALMDPVMTIMRPLAALLTAVSAGSLVNLFERRGWADDPAAAAAAEAASPTSCGCDDGCSIDHGSAATQVDRSDWRAVVRASAHYAFGPLMRDLTPSFVFGFLLSAIIMVIVPDDLLANTLPSGWPSMLAMLVIGIPVYICATASTPVAAALVAKGLDPGAALVFLLAGPATNMATLHAVRSFLGKRVLIAYLASIAALSLLMGWLVNGIYSTFRIAPFAADQSLESIGWISMTGGVVLAALLVKHAASLNLGARYIEHLKRWLAPLGISPSSMAVKVALVVLLVGSWLGTMFSVLQVGDEGFLLRFGAVIDTYDQAGLYLHWPYPVDRVETVRFGEIRAVNPTAEESETTTPAVATATDVRASASEIMSGDENILRMVYALHSRVSDAYRFRFDVEDPEPLLMGLTESCVRAMAAHRTANDMLVATRPELEREVEERLQAELDAIGAGVEVVGIHLLDIHAPPAVHEAFRDVASALEDKERHVREGEKYQIERVAGARASAYASEQAATAEKFAKINGATGDVAAFVALRDAVGGAGSVNRFRLRMEAAEKGLRGAKSVLVLDDNVDVILTSDAAGLRAATRSPLGP